MKDDQQFNLKMRLEAQDMAEASALLIDVQQESSKTTEIVARLGWIQELPFDNYGRVEWSKVAIPKSKFALLKGITIKHHDVPESSNIQLHPDGEFDMETTLTLEEGEEILGFQFHEVKDPESGASELYHPQVLLSDGKATWLEPLSRHWFDPAPYPGKVQWLPATAGPGVVSGREVINLRAMQGREYNHIVGVIYSSRWSIQSLTGQSVFFWLDTLGLVLGMFYADIALDIKQLVLFYNKGLFDYCLFNGLGLLMPPIVTIREALRWQHKSSPEKDFVNRLIKSDFFQKIFIVGAIASQTHMLLLVMLSVHFRKKHPLLEAAKHAEVAESAVSALVQTNFIMSVVVGVQSVASLDLNNADLQSMAISIGVSCCSAGLSFAGRDKTDATVLGLPGKITWSPTMACLVLVRSLEVASRMIAFNLIQVTLRGTWFLGHASGPIAVLLYAAAAGCCLREAELADILASVVAHPGQILAPHSLLLLRHSLMLHVLLVLAAGVPQVLMRTEYSMWMPADTKEFPMEYLLGWLLITICGFTGLYLLSLYGSWLDHPAIAALCEEHGSILLSSVVASFKAKDSQVPKAVVASLGNRVIKLDTSNLTRDSFQEVIDTECPVDLSVTSFNHLVRLFSEDFGYEDYEAAPREVMKRLKCCNLVSLDLWDVSFRDDIPALAWQQLRGAKWPKLKNANFCGRFCFQGEGAADLLEVLGHSQELKVVNFYECSRIPAVAWQKLRGAKWPQLKKVDFEGCFKSQGEGAADLLEVLGHSHQLEDVKFSRCSHIPAAAWQQLRGAKWPKLKKANFASCFESQGEGAADLLEVLGHSHELDEVDFGDCSHIPAAAWRQVPSGAWPKLQSPSGIPEEEERRIRLDEGLPEDGGSPRSPHGSPSERAEDDRVPLAAPRRLKSVVAWALHSYKGTVELMAGLSLSQELEEVNLEFCDQIPASVWQQLRGAKWPKLKKANFASCFKSQGEGAADLLEALDSAQELEVVNFYECFQIPAVAWQKLRGAKWPKLKKAYFNSCFKSQGEGAADLLQVLGHSHELEEASFSSCHQIPAVAWQKLRGAKWPKLKKAYFDSCFQSQGEGAADLLEVLGHAHDLGFVDFQACPQIPAAAWSSRIPSGAWPKLENSYGIPQEEVLRIRARTALD